MRMILHSRVYDMTEHYPILLSLVSNAGRLQKVSLIQQAAEVNQLCLYIFRNPDERPHIYHLNKSWRVHPRTKVQKDRRNEVVIRT
ncbi:hypothetical protein VTI74DRAFT_11401 [Chaetomium olivicolor]